MTRPVRPWIDWKQERTQIASLLNLQGGVLQVRCSTQGPLVEFSSALRSWLEHGDWTRKWTTVQFDAENSNTRYFGEMTRQIERSLSIPPGPISPLVAGAGSKIASDLRASAINISDSFNGDGYSQAVLEEGRLDELLTAIRVTLENQAVCFLFMESEKFRRQDLRKFKELLWTDGLENHRTNGVLLVDLTRIPPDLTSDWPPCPDIELVLADSYDEAARDNAITDLTSLLLTAGLEESEAEASAYSRAMLDSHRGPATLYAQLAALFAAGKAAGKRI